MNKPCNCEECDFYHICRAYYLGPGCEYSEKEVRKHGEDSNS